VDKALVAGIEGDLPVPKLSTSEPLPKRFTAAEPLPRASALELPIETARFTISVEPAPACVLALVPADKASPRLDAIALLPVPTAVTELSRL
jgi:hypothetical protein